MTLPVISMLSFEIKHATSASTCTMVWALLHWIFLRPITFCVYSYDKLYGGMLNGDHVVI